VTVRAVVAEPAVALVGEIEVTVGGAGVVCVVPDELEAPEQPSIRERARRHTTAQHESNLFGMRTTGYPRSGVL
jgi:hypothetical protein